jgi:3-hydroxy-9,10-secoandrosta-1,3,5(10)-triene-9,17-dione monooxygenase
MTTRLDSRTVPVPEPGLTPSAMIERARALQSRLRDEQGETERRSVHSEALHQEFRKAGFYRCLQPRRFGGYEFDIKTFLRLAIELARGCPSTAWCVILGAGHALTLASYFPEQTQIDVFGPDGEFCAPCVAAPLGTATQVSGGWVINGTWTYASGAPYATHFMPCVQMPGSKPGEIRSGLGVLPRSQWTMLDDWGAILGLRGSGSNSIRVDQQHVPESYVVPVDMLDADVSGGTPGSRLHGNPMYAGRCLSFFHGELVSLMVGLGYAAIDEYEKLIRARSTLFPPFTPRYLNPEYQRVLGLALGMVNAAERLALNVGELYMEYCRRGFEGGKPFSLREDLELFTSTEHGGRLVWEAVELLFRTASTTAAKDGQRLQRYYRDISIYRGHISSQYEIMAQRLAILHLGLTPEGQERPGTIGSSKKS